MSHCKRVWEIIKDGQPHSNHEIVDRMFPGGKAGLFRLGARVFNINEKLKKKHNGRVVGWTDKHDRTKYWYKLKRVNVEPNGQFLMV